jgi:hypothetical protein
VRLTYPRWLAKLKTGAADPSRVTIDFRGPGGEYSFPLMECDANELPEPGTQCHATCTETKLDEKFRIPSSTREEPRDGGGASSLALVKEIRAAQDALYNRVLPTLDHFVQTHAVLLKRTEDLSEVNMGLRADLGSLSSRDADAVARVKEAEARSARDQKFLHLCETIGMKVLHRLNVQGVLEEALGDLSEETLAGLEKDLGPAKMTKLIAIAAPAAEKSK